MYYDIYIQSVSEIMVQTTVSDDSMCESKWRSEKKEKKEITFSSFKRLFSNKSNEIGYFPRCNTIGDTCNRDEIKIFFHLKIIQLDRKG